MKNKKGKLEVSAEAGTAPGGNVGETTVDDRGKWDNPAEFVLSCLGYAVGLGNVWRFPYLCFTNGGGAFLIPYVIMLTFVGLPAFFLELIIGQWSECGPATVWHISPLFKGMFIGMVSTSFLGSMAYNMVIAWSLYYFFSSFQKTLPWDGCDHDFNDNDCYSKREAEPCEAQNGIWSGRVCYNATYLASFDEERVSCNATSCVKYLYNGLRESLELEGEKQVSSSEQYFNNFMLDRSSRIEDTGAIKWDITLAYLGAWMLCFLCIIKGIKSTGKVVYFTATFPYVLLVILFFRGVTLEGAGDGIKFFLLPKWEKLKNGKVWADAAGQIFYSLSVGSGGLMTFASYNRFHNNIYRDTMIVAIGNSLTSIFAGFVIFSILGHMAHVLGKEVENVATSGSGLAFIAYPEVVTLLPVPQLWSALFFFMLVTLGLDSLFAGMENIMTALQDSFPGLRPKKTLIAFGLCSLFFVLGLTMCTRSGIFWMELMNYYLGSWSTILAGITEAIVFVWIYGARKLVAHVREMTGIELHLHWWFVWTFVSPLILFAVLVFNIIDFTPLSYGTYELPGWAQALGWLMAIASLSLFPVYAVVLIVQTYNNSDYDGMSLFQRIVKLTRPTEKWKSALERAADRRIEGVYRSAASLASPPAGDATEVNGKPSAPPGYANPAFEEGITKF